MTNRLLSLAAKALLLLSFASCATTTPDPAGVGAQLKGRVIKLRAHSALGGPSELGFLELKFRSCDSAGKHASCVVDFASESAQGRGKAFVEGKDGKINVTLKASQELRYRLDAEVDLAWDGKRWSGKGDVAGDIFPAFARVPSSRTKPTGFREQLDF